MDARSSVESCLHCESCTAECAFLGKYSLDLGGFTKRPDLAFHCFLCGNCSEVCPQGIDGRQVSLSLRREVLTSPGAPTAAKPYRVILAEKRDYLFKNYRRATSGAVFFPGCNLAGYLPRTTRAIAVFFRRNGIGSVFDCCAKPVLEFGGTELAAVSLEKLRSRLQKAGIREIITACPNCYHFLKEHTELKLTDVFHSLKKLKFLSARLDEGPVFVPCPDRKEHLFLHSARELLELDLQPLEGVQCCGLGGGAMVHEPEIVRNFREVIRTGGKSYVYCASCAAALGSAGCDARHLLAGAFDVHEEPRLGFAGLLHRCLFKFY